MKITFSARLQKWSALLLIVVSVAGGCATARVTPEFSEQIRQMSELRDTCTQYAAWSARSLKPESSEYRHVQQLYIEASSAANGYLDALQFDVTVGAEYTPEKYADVAKRVHDSSDKFLNTARASLGVNQTRALPLLLIPMAETLVSLVKNISSAARERRREDRAVIAHALADKKWKPFNELVP